MRSQHEHFRCALVTGASAGIGAEFARQLAPSCETLVLTARRRERLVSLAEELAQQYPNLTIHVHGADLAKDGDVDDLLKELAQQKLIPDLVVNNAGLGDYGEFLSAEWERVESMLSVNVRALTRLTHALLPAMAETGGGAVLNVSSIAGDFPIPDFAVYAATKAYVTSFSEALRIEARPHGIRVMALCPGPVKTEFGDVARRDPGTVLPGQGDRLLQVSKETVVAEALAALAGGKARHYPGWKVAASAALIGLLPIALLRLILGCRPHRR